MNEIYWITRLDSVNRLLVGVSITSFIVALVLTIAWFVIIGDLEEKFRKMIGRFAIYAISLTLLCELVNVFIPTTNEALAIYGIGGTIDYIKDNDKAKQLPDKVVDALDKYLDSVNEKESKED